MSTLYLCQKCGSATPQKYQVDGVTLCETCVTKDFKRRHPFTWNLGLHAPVTLPLTEKQT